MKRIYQGLLDEYLEMFPCVALLGARQCGKTTLLHTLGTNWKYYDLERRNDFNVISDDPDLFFRLNPGNIAIDEAQLLPELFPALRVAIDSNRSQSGRFVITGSSSPELLSSISESLAGRVGIIEISPFLWAELEDSPSISALIEHIINGNTDPHDLIENLKERSSLGKAHQFWFNGGYPEPWMKNDKRFFERWAEQYSQTYLQRDVARLFPGLNHLRFGRFLQMLGGLSGQVINVAQVARDLSVSQPTAHDYFTIAHGTFLWRTIPAFSGSSTKRVVRHSKGYLRDTGILHHLLRIPDLDALLSHPQAGASWEGLVIEEILRQFSASGVQVIPSFYRTGAGAEVDLVCEGRFGTVPFEIKRGGSVDLRDLKGLRSFVEEQGCPFGVVINNDIAPRQYSEKIIGVPFTFL